MLVDGIGTKGRLENNNIWGTRESCVHIQKGSDPLVIGNRIHDGQIAGVAFSGIGTKGLLEGNDIFSNKLVGVEVRGRQRWRRRGAAGTAPLRRRWYLLPPVRPQLLGRSF